MSDIFEEFVKEYTKSFGDNTKLIDSLKKQYKMYRAERETMDYLRRKYNTSHIRQKQFTPIDFDSFFNHDIKGHMLFDDNIFNFEMGINNTFVVDVPYRNTKCVYLIEGIASETVPGVNINNISFYIGNELMHTVAGYQINNLYYLESPVLAREGERLKIDVNLSTSHYSFPILFIGYKFCVGE
jgi:hypothetical protein